MNRRVGPHGKNLIALLLVIALGGVGPSAFGESTETWQVGDTTYYKVRVREVTPATVTIFHSRGIQQLELSSLPPELQERFGYDAAGAADWEEQTHAARQEQAEERVAGRQQRLAAQPGKPAHDILRGIDPATVVIHDEVDLRPTYRDMGLFSKDQGRRPSCSVFAVVSALEYESGLQNGTPERLSEEFLIWAMRKMHPGIPVDDGYHFREVISALQAYGVPPFELMPNTIGKSIEDIQPTSEAIAAAEPRRSVATVWFRADDPQLLERIVGALNHGKPVIIGIRWPNWRTFWDTNLLHKQTPMEDAGHAVTLVGYRKSGASLDEMRFIFRNSFGPEWGLGGYAFVTGRYLRENLLSALYLNVP